MVVFTRQRRPKGKPKTAVFPLVKAEEIFDDPRKFENPPKNIVDNDVASTFSQINVAVEKMQGICSATHDLLWSDFLDHLFDGE